MVVAVDLAEFFQRPHRSGIQRVGAELCFGWAGAEQAKPIMCGPQGKLLSLRPDALFLLSRFFRAEEADCESTYEEICALGHEALARKQEFVPGPNDLVVVPEVFFDPARIDFYAAALRASWFRIAFIVFDVLPLTHPSAFPLGSDDAYRRYAGVVGWCRHVAFISAATALAFRERFGGSGHPVVLPLGSDALRRDRVLEKPLPDRPRFAVLGTIEPRKNHLLVLKAFRRVWRRFPDVELVFAGRMGWLGEEEKRMVQHAVAEHPQFVWHQNVNDQLIESILARTTATIFVSGGEGFGLPPVESLWCGTPCIVSRGIPSLESVGEQGIHPLNALDSDMLADAVERFLDPTYAALKTQEALHVPLITWHEFGQRAREWLISLPAGPSARTEMLQEVCSKAPDTWRNRLMAALPPTIRPIIRTAAKRLLRI